MIPARIAQYLASDHHYIFHLRKHDIWWFASILAPNGSTIYGTHGHTPEDAIAALDLALESFVL